MRCRQHDVARMPWASLEDTRRVLGEGGDRALALRWAQSRRLLDGLTLFGDAIDVQRGADLSLCCNALWP